MTLHTLHIPVMGTGFSIDTPIKVARYGISSVISLVDDVLIEKMRRFYCDRTGEPYQPIANDDEDHRARRITEYLNLVDRIVNKQFEELKRSAFEKGSEITKYFELLPESSPLQPLYRKMLATMHPPLKEKLQNQLRESILPGDINVNIMTKLDRTNYAEDGTELPSEHSDALSALRGYAHSTLNSAIVFSAGINRRLYSYVENFKDFFADTTGFIKKKIILKVSDYRSSITQGKFFAKKGLWVSEYRIESGLNCGGHAFPTDGYLMGPVLEEFKAKKQELIDTLHEIYNQIRKIKNLITFSKPHAVRITAQGGIGTAKENKFLLDYYGLDGTGWGTPFLLVPEVTNVDSPLLEKLAAATKENLYLSDVSPLGIPFHTLKDSPSEQKKFQRIQEDRPGSACPKGYLVSNTEFTPKPICTASRQYQKLKLEQLKAMNLSEANYKLLFDHVTSKACICNDLGESVLIKNGIETTEDRHFPAICPGPNLAYFSKIVTLKEMMDHVYGRINLLTAANRPHMFIEELRLYVDYFKAEIKKYILEPAAKHIEYLREFKNNLMAGMEYYKNLFPNMLEEAENLRQTSLEELREYQNQMEELIAAHSFIFSDSPSLAAPAVV